MTQQTPQILIRFSVEGAAQQVRDALKDLNAGPAEAQVLTDPDGAAGKRGLITEFLGLDGVGEAAVEGLFNVLVKWLETRADRSIEIEIPPRKVRITNPTKEEARQLMAWLQEQTSQTRADD